MSARRYFPRDIILFLAIIVGLSCWLGQGQNTPARAASALGVAQFSITPVYYDPKTPITRSYFVFAGKAGKTIDSQVRVSNEGSVAGDAALYAVDAATGSSSGVVYMDHQQTPAVVGKWLTLDLAQVHLAAGASAIITFHLVVPQDAQAGQYVGGIVAQDLAVEGSQLNGAVQLRVQRLSIVAVEVNLAGAVQSVLKASGMHLAGQDGLQVIDVSLSNQGNQLLRPSGTLVIKNAQGQVVQHFSLMLDTILPNSTIDYPVFVEKSALTAGTYTGFLDLTYAQQHLTFTTTFDVTDALLTQIYAGHGVRGTVPVLGGMAPWQVALLLGIGALLALNSIFLLRQRRNQLVPKSVAIPLQRVQMQVRD
jgi:hypothetical protein